MGELLNVCDTATFVINGMGIFAQISAIHCPLQYQRILMLQKVESSHTLIGFEVFMSTTDTCKAFCSLVTREDVAELLNISDRSLRYFLFKIRPENMYHSFQVQKANGGYRTISAPQKPLMEIQKKLAIVLSEVYSPKVCAYGFIKGKSIVGNAQKHISKRFVFNIDLKDFFSQIHFGRICGLLQNKPYCIGREAAITIAQISCLNGKLPQGAPSSPIITNMICAPLDNSLMRLAKRTKCVYTRYADDITFSTYMKAFDNIIVYVDELGCHVGSALESILRKHSFLVNPDKIKLSNRSSRQEVTGLTVNVLPNMRRSYLKQLRAILHSSEKYGLYNAAKTYVSKGLCNNSTIRNVINQPDMEEKVVKWFISVLIGKTLYIRQVKGVESFTYFSIAKKVNSIVGSDVFDIKSFYWRELQNEYSLFILEEDINDIIRQGSGFFLAGYGLITSHHVTEDEGFYDVYNYREYKSSRLGIVSKTCNEISSDSVLDYALYNLTPPLSVEHAFQVGDSRKLTIGDSVTLISCPDPQERATPSIIECKITRQKYHFHAPLFTVSGRIVRGCSGGIVVNSKYEAIGIIKSGIVDISDVKGDSIENQGFIPLHLVIEHIDGHRTH